MVTMYNDGMCFAQPVLHVKSVVGSFCLDRMVGCFRRSFRRRTGGTTTEKRHAFSGVCLLFVVAPRSLVLLVVLVVLVVLALLVVLIVLIGGG